MLLGPLGVGVGVAQVELPSPLAHWPESDGCVVPELLGLVLCAAADWLVSVQARTKRTSEADTSAERTTKRVTRRPAVSTGAAAPLMRGEALARVTSPKGWATQLRT